MQNIVWYYYCITMGDWVFFSVADYYGLLFQDVNCVLPVVHVVCIGIPWFNFREMDGTRWRIIIQGDQP